MARTWDSRRLRHERDVDRRLTEAHRQLARNIGALVMRAPRDGAVIANRRAVRDALNDAIWTQVLKPFYIGQGDSPLDGANPRSPYAQILVAGVSGAVRIQAERQASMLRSVVRDEAVLQWLTGPRPPEIVTEQARGSYDPFHRFVDPNGYRLSDRVWRAAVDVRSRVDRLLEYHIPQGTDPVRIAELLEDYLTPGARLIRTNTPYGVEGSYAARRLARTEVAAASGRAATNAAIANPYMRGMQWVLAAGHSDIDPCDANANGGPDRDGVYPFGSVPPFPNHPHCTCRLVPVRVRNVADVTARLRGDIAQNAPRARLVRGLFNPAWLTGALLGGAILDILHRLREQDEQPENEPVRFGFDPGERL